MTLRLIAIRPDGSEFEPDTDEPILSKSDAGMWAGLTLASVSGPLGVRIDEMGAFGDTVTAAPLGEAVTHTPSGYSFRTEESAS